MFSEQRRAPDVYEDTEIVTSVSNKSIWKWNIFKKKSPESTREAKVTIQASLKPLTEKAYEQRTY